MKFHLQALYRNLVAGARLALFLPVRAFDYRASPADYALLLAFNFLVWIAAAAIRTGAAGEFDSAAIAIYFGSVPLVLVTALIVARIYGERERLLLIATALTASDPLFELVVLVLPPLAELAGYPRLAVLAILAWIWVVSLRAVVVCAGTRRPQVLKGALAVTAMVAVGFFAFPRTDVWVEPAEEREPDPLAGEQVFHLQGQLIERALAAIAPGKPGVRELYFVGFAPDASQDVFVKEMRFVRRLFDERFGTAGRSIALASSRDALEEFPIASVTNLARALTRVGERMNADEDLLFLFITAHGSRDHRLSAVQPPLELASLTPTALGRLLQDAGIKWRVIVVSACYSGGFIEPLRDANSVVITASSAERTSFGCEPGRDFTYFGEAYFRDALARTRSFVQAFDIAKAAVGKQEAAERLEASLPQMWVGPAIAARLKQPADAPDKE
ncbi:MAG TPA: C13 family peptidase [Burkholderiales bacterium]|nr:C13 family peptidase [Burkholderiales bacterium]